MNFGGAQVHDTDPGFLDPDHDLDPGLGLFTIAVPIDSLYIVLRYWTVCNWRITNALLLLLLLIKHENPWWRFELSDWFYTVRHNYWTPWFYCIAFKQIDKN